MKLPAGKLKPSLCALALLLPLLTLGQRASAESRVLSRAWWLPEPIVADDACGHMDDAALSDAIKTSKGQTNLKALNDFLTAHQNSCYASAVALDLGLALEQRGYDNEALQILRQGWANAQSAQSGSALSYANRLGAELAHLEASFGLQDETEQLLATLKVRKISGQTARQLDEVRDIAWMMKHTPDEARKCGSIALEEVYRTFHKESFGTKYSHHPKTDKKGLSLSMLQKISEQMGMPMVPVRISGNADIPVPSVVHLKVGHYAAIVGKTDKGYELHDPSLRLQLQVTKQLLEQESSGNYMVLASATIAPGWTRLNAAEARTVWGKGQTSGSTPPLPPCQQESANACSYCPPGNGGSGSSACTGMPIPNINLQYPALTLADKPVVYQSPVGPPLDFTLSYQENMPGQGTTPSYGGFGTNWSSNWDARLVTVPGSFATCYYNCNGGTCAGTGEYFNYTLYSRGGGTLAATQASQYGIVVSPLYYFIGCESEDYSPTVTISYPSGWKEVYTEQNELFLSQLIDPQGNVTTLSYDNVNGYERLRQVTSANGQAMVLDYDPVNVQQVISVQTPSGAIAHFGYNENGELSRITDALGLTTTLAYDATSTDQIDSMTTPYGTWNFTTDPVNPSDPYDVQSLDIVDPVGQHQRAQYGHLLYSCPSEPLPTGMALSSSLQAGEAYWNYRDTYYWNANTMAQVGSNYADAMVYHWQHTYSSGQESGVLESTKNASQARVFYDYPGQTSPLFNSASGLNLPEDVARVLDNGTTQHDEYQYNSIGLVTQHIDPSGRELNYTYASNNVDLLSVTDGGGDVLASFAYNGAPHRPTTVTDAGGGATALSYNGAGQLTGIQLPTGESTTLNYDGNGFLTQITPPAPGTTVSFTPDSAERIATSTDAVNGTLTYSYDALNRLTKITYPDNSYEQIAYNLLDVASTRDRDGRVTHYTHDAARRLTGIQDPQGRLIQLAWCDCGALTALTDGAGHTTNWAYNFMDQLISKTYADGSKVSYGFDTTISLLKTITDAMGQETSYTYNLSNQLTNVQYQNAVNATPNVTFSYEPVLGCLAAMIDGTGTTEFGYNPFSPGPGAGLLATVQGPLSSSTVQYGYDASQRLTSVGVNGTAETYQYNPYGQLAGVTNPLGNFTYAYDSAGRLNQVKLPGSVTTALSYYPSSQSGRLEDITHDSPAMALLAQYGYNYDPAGQITTWTQQQGTTPLKTDLPEYDLASQLTGTAETLGSVQNALTWTYDLAGNRTQSTFDGIPTAYTNNDLNQVTQMNPAKIRVAGQTSVSATVTVNGITATALANNSFGVYVAESVGAQVLTITAQNSTNSLTQHYQVQNGAQLQYDADGELINDGINQYSWDAANRLIQITQLHPITGAQAHTSQFVYDGFSRRVEDKELQGVQVTEDRRFIYDRARIAEERDQHNNVIKRFYGGGVQVVSGPQVGTYTYLKDHLGSIRAVLNSNGNAVATLDYDIWGNLTQTSGTFTPDFGYAGYFEHQPSKLALTWYRAYSPTLGRWISRDPFAEVEGPNLYRTTYNSPLNYSDPFGLCTVLEYPAGSAPAGIPINYNHSGIEAGGQEWSWIPSGPWTIPYLYAPGSTYHDPGQPIDSANIPTSPQQDQAINNYWNNLPPGNWNAFNNNCTSQVCQSLQAAGFNVPFMNTPGELMNWAHNQQNQANGPVSPTPVRSCDLPE